MKTSNKEHFKVTQVTKEFLEFFVWAMLFILFNLNIAVPIPSHEQKKNLKSAIYTTV